MPKIAPVTAILFTYNQENFVADAAWSILNQTIPPQEVILSDDCSTDKTYDILLQITKEYQGPSKIKVRKNAKNVRTSKHVNLAVQEATHDWISPHAGDDICEPERMETFLKYQKQNPNVRFFWSAVWPMTWDGKVANSPHPDIPLSIGHSCMRAEGKGNIPLPGIPKDRQNDLRFLPWGVGASQFWHRSLFSFFGPIPAYVSGEDAVLPFRARCLGDVFFIPEPLVCWREHCFSVMPEQDRNRLYARDHLVRLTSARCQAADLGLFLKKTPHPPQAWKKLHTELLSVVTQEQKLIDQAFLNRDLEFLKYKHCDPFPIRLRFILAFIRRHGPIRPARLFFVSHIIVNPTRQARNHFITRILKAPASLEEKIGRRTARLLALILAIIAATTVSLGIRHLGVPMTAMGATLMLICAYPVAILLIRTAIRILISSKPTP